MTKYIFRQTYPVIWIISFLLILFLGITIVFVVLNAYHINSKLFFIIGVIFFLIVALIFPRHISSCLIEMSIDDKGIKKKVIKKSRYQKSSEYEIEWLEISNYIFEPARQFDKFKILLINGDKFKLHHNNDDNNKDDFIKFINDFQAKVKEKNNENEITHKIEVGQTIYERKTGLIIGIFALIIIVGVPVLFFTGSFKKSVNFAAIAGIYLGAIIYLTIVIMYRTKSKQ